MPIQTIFLLILAVVTFVVLPIVLVWSMIDYFRGKGSDRGGGGGVSSAIGGAMLEMDRAIRPSVEHQIEAQQESIQPDDEKGGE